MVINRSLDSSRCLYVRLHLLFSRKAICHNHFWLAVHFKEPAEPVGLVGQPRIARPDDSLRALGFAAEIVDTTGTEIYRAVSIIC
jgi:hypothetical protein